MNECVYTVFILQNNKPRKVQNISRTYTSTSFVWFRKR